METHASVSAWMQCDENDCISANSLWTFQNCGDSSTIVDSIAFSFGNLIRSTQLTTTARARLCNRLRTCNRQRETRHSPIWADNIIKLTRFFSPICDRQRTRLNRLMHRNRRDCTCSKWKNATEKYCDKSLHRIQMEKRDHQIWVNELALRWKENAGIVPCDRDLACTYAHAHGTAGVNGSSTVRN